MLEYCLLQAKRGPATRRKDSIKLETSHLGPVGWNGDWPLDFFLLSSIKKTPNNQKEPKPTNPKLFLSVLRQSLGDPAVSGTGKNLWLRFDESSHTEAVCRLVVEWEGLSSSASPCSRGLEALSANEMRRNMEKNKRIRQTVRQRGSFTEISDAKLLFSHMVPVCFPLQIQSLLCVFQKMMVFPGVGAPSFKTNLPRSIAFGYWEAGEIHWGCDSGMNLVKSSEDELVNTHSSLSQVYVLILNRMHHWELIFCF